MNERPRAILEYLVLLFSLGLVVSLAVAGLVSMRAGQSFGMGVLSVLVPQAWFTLRTLRSPSDSAQTIAVNFLRAESGKFMLTAAAMALVFRFWPDILASAALIGLCSALAVQIFAGVKLTRRLSHLDNEGPRLGEKRHKP